MTTCPWCCPKPRLRLKARRRSNVERESSAKSRQNERGRIKSKAEIAADSREAVAAGLEKPIDRSNKGFKMMEKLGFNGGALGRQGAETGITQPINPVVREDRGGIGLDSDKKRKIREQMQGQAKKMKASEEEYFERVRRDKEEKRLHGQIIGAMKVAERLDEDTANELDKAENGNKTEQEQVDPSDREVNADSRSGAKNTAPGKGRLMSAKPLRSINVLWRGLAKHQMEKARDKRMRSDLQQHLSRLPRYEDTEADKEDWLAYGSAEDSLVKEKMDEEELDEEDPELDAFNALEPAERLEKLVEHLRRVHWYCFWCKHQYDDQEMDGCPGLSEEEHP